MKRRDPDKTREANARYREKHLEEIREKARLWANDHKEEARAYRFDNREKILARNKAYYIANKHKCLSSTRAYTFKKKYGMSIEEWNKLFLLQKGRCPICKSKFTTAKASKRFPVIHHCHGPSNHVHGLICNTCNLAEAYLGTPEVALSMYNYMLQDELLSYASNGNKR